MKPSHTRRRVRGLAVTAIAASLISAVASPAFAQSTASTDRQQVLMLRIEQLVGEGRCVEALPEIERARQKAPQDARLALREGQCAIRTFDYARAVTALREAKRLSPDLEDVDVNLAIALYHHEDFAGASAAIKDAQGHVSRDYEPQYELYRGLLLLYERDEREAALALERARVADAAQVEPVASYYAGLAWRSVNEREQARAAFQRVIDLDGDGPWGRRARAAISGEALEDRTWATVRAGLEYDSNVVLLGEQIPLPGTISGESDGRAVWFIDGGAELFRTDNWSGGVIGSYAGSANFHLNDFDANYPVVSGWLDRQLGERDLLRARYGVGYAWVDYESFATTQDASLSLFHNWGAAGNSELSVGWDWNDYHFLVPYVPTANSNGTCPYTTWYCSPPGIDAQASQNRDGNGLLAGLVHHYPVQALEGEWMRSFELRGGFHYLRYWAEGTDWDRREYDFAAGFYTELPWSVDLDARGSFTYAPFDDPSTYLTPPVTIGLPYALSTQDRLDQIWRVLTIAERPITDWLTASARYEYTRNVSNVAVFDYRRHLVGGYLAVRF